MFNQFAFQAVEGAQTAQKQFLNTFVQHEQFKQVLVNFVDAQAEYTKSAITAGSDIFTKTGEILTDRTPLVKVSEKFAEYFPAAFGHTTKKGK